MLIPEGHFEDITAVRHWTTLHRDSSTLTANRVWMRHADELVIGAAASEVAAVNTARAALAALDKLLVSDVKEAAALGQKRDDALDVLGRARAALLAKRFCLFPFFLLQSDCVRQVIDAILNGDRYGLFGSFGRCLTQGRTRREAAEVYSEYLRWVGLPKYAPEAVAGENDESVVSLRPGGRRPSAWILSPRSPQA